MAGYEILSINTDQQLTDNDGVFESVKNKITSEEKKVRTVREEPKVKLSNSDMVNSSV